MKHNSIINKIYKFHKKLTKLVIKISINKQRNIS